MDITIIRAKKDLYNVGKCFTAGKEYTVSGAIRNEAGLMDVKTINDLGEDHIIGSFWRDFEIVRPEAEEEEEAEEQPEPPKNIIDIIAEQMDSDDTDRDKQSELLLKYYREATEFEKKAINNITICLCGWGIDTIIDNPKQFE